MTAKEAGEAIRRRRKALRLTQQDLAEMVGVNRRLISELERGFGTTTVRNLHATCDALGLSILIQPVDRS
jgi:transcriptional regulator with XRE-family HTH domain